MTFIRKKENFKCKNCQAVNIGDGYTDHCKECLWSKHIDIDPGDREERCLGMMEPVEAETKNGELRIKNRCVVCGFERWAPVLPKDDFEKVLDTA